MSDLQQTHTEPHDKIRDPGVGGGFNKQGQPENGLIDDDASKKNQMRQAQQNEMDQEADQNTQEQKAPTGGAHTLNHL